MKVRLTKPNRIDGREGETVEVSPLRAEFLIRYGLAEPAEIREQIVTPEKQTAKKTTRTAKAESGKKEAKTKK